MHLEAGLAVASTKRLVAQGDEVRWVGAEKQAGGLKAAGAFVARGDVADDDFIWRAALGCRTVVFGAERSPEEVSAIVTGGKRAEVERLICLASELPASLHDRLSGSGLEYALLLTGGGGWLARRKISNERLAEAIDAADDTAGSLHDVLDLTEAAGWQKLGLVSD